jgi:uncharacterized RmlC-like cupin family protein
VQVTRRAESIARDKADGTSVRYYIFPEYEVHANEIEPGSTQQWHHHELIEEVIYVVSGRLVVIWQNGSAVETEELATGDLVRVGTSAHTLANRSSEVARFVVFRMVPDGTDKRDLMRGDKHVDAPPS